ncbi:MAG TPA: hypothetical protein VLA34_09290, partial [Candidatus Krumholzibacterium sp.]|nr:hypothetical protein [Candidatus Krumholzibacterium sp.]
SFLVATLRDNGKAWLSDAAIDKDDAVAVYKGLLKVRGMLKKWGCLLWVEPSGGSEGRFRFTFPRTTVMTDYLLLQEGDARVAIPRRVVEASYESGTLEETAIRGIQHVELDGDKVPVCGLEELATEEIDAPGTGKDIVIVGLAEKRLGLRVSSAGQKVEGIVDQLTGGDWAGLTREVLHIGDVECPVLDVGLVLDKYASALGFEGAMEESGFSSAEDDVEDTVGDRISRV